MPGLAGLLSDVAEPVLFVSMQAAMNHRNYSIKNFTQDGLHVSHLHVKDAEKGLRHSADGKLTVVFHGDLFSVDGEDSAVITDSAGAFLKLIEKNGFEILAKLNGQFQACVYDHVSKTVYLISDRFGIQPLYYTIARNRLLFASEVKSLLKDSFSKHIDYRGIADMFAFGYLLGNKTLFENIYRLPPATLLAFREGKITQSVYWTLPYSETNYAPQKIESRKSKEFVNNLCEILITATQRQAVDANKLIIPLSGGLDSRYVAALYHQIGTQKVTTFTMGPDDSEDQLYGEQVAKHLGFPHRKFDINPANTWKAASLFSYVADGMSNISGPLQNFEALEYFSSTKEILTASQMCDALFGSTLFRSRIKTLQKNEQSRTTSDSILINLFKAFDQNQVKLLFHPEVYEKFRGLYTEVPQQYCSNEYHPLHNYFRMLMMERGRRGTMGGNITSNMFYQMRMLSYDNAVFDFGWNLPITYREHQYLYRKTFSQLFPELAKIKRQGFGLKISASQTQYELKVLENKIATLALRSPLAPFAKLYKPWSRPTYVNYKQWFRNELREDLINFLTTKELKCASLINGAYVKTLVEEHIQGRHDNTAILWQVINLEYFFRNFID